jgi:REP element-mobilizing transposase RayT
MRLIIFPPQNNPRSPSIAGLNAQAYLKKPFYLPTLQKTINKLLAAHTGPGAPGGGETTGAAKRKKKNEKTAPTAAVFSNTFELLTADFLPVAIDPDDPSEPEPTINLAELEQVRKSWSREAELDGGKENTAGVQTSPEPTANLADTQPVRALERSSPIPAEADTIYTCMLTPLQPDHYLRFDLASALERWMRQASAYENWTLLSLSIRPTHIKWTVRIPAGTAADEMLNYCREFTSKNIFLQFPVFANNNPTQNFWAPDHLIQRGERSLTRQQIYAVVAASHLPSLQPPATLLTCPCGHPQQVQAPAAGAGTRSESSFIPHP